MFEVMSVSPRWVHAKCSMGKRVVKGQRPHVEYYVPRCVTTGMDFRSVVSTVWVRLFGAASQTSCMIPDLAIARNDSLFRDTWWKKRKMGQS